MRNLVPRPPIAGPTREAAWLARCVGRGATAPLAAADLAALAVDLETRRFARGSLIFGSATAPTGVWVVRAGSVELSIRHSLRRVVLEVLGPGDVYGDLELLLQLSMPYAARAVTDVELLFLPAARFRAVLAEHPAITFRWLTSVAQRLGASHRRVADLLGRPLTAQLARLLIDLAKEGSVALRQETLAAMLGVRRPTLNRLLAKWGEERIVNIGYGRLDIIDHTRLAELANA